MAFALAFLNALFEAAEDAGLSVTRASIPTALVVAGVQVPFSLIENKRSLTLVLGDNVGDAQRLWADTTAAALEDQVTDILAAARWHAQAIETRDRAIADRVTSRLAEEVERLAAKLKKGLSEFQG
ncbi:MAG: hypothetical protein ISP49_14515 [Reyranella sp.]|nr:hypothetical protein [Reyranella sp.]